jgi:Nitroreductase family
MAISAMTTEELYDCLRAATAAPSIHNTQPWRFVARPGQIEVRADMARRLRVVDPSGRALHISCGAALFNLRVAVGYHGRHCRTLLMPDRSAPVRLATVDLYGRRQVGDVDRALHAAIPHRHSNRAPFSDRSVPSDVVRQITEAAWAEGGRLRVLDPNEGALVLAVVRSADLRQRNDPAYRAELRAWTTDDPDRMDGVPRSAFGPWNAMELVSVRDFGLDWPVSGRPAERFESQPTMAILSTDGDEPAEWLRAGMALQRVLLQLTMRGLSASLMTQPLELPPLRGLLAQTALDAPQVILRVGYGGRAAPSPRRPVDEVLE